MLKAKTPPSSPFDVLCIGNTARQRYILPLHLSLSVGIYSRYLWVYRLIVYTAGVMAAVSILLTLGCICRIYHLRYIRDDVIAGINYSPVHIMFERLEAVSVLNIWQVIRCQICQNSQSLPSSAIATKVRTHAASPVRCAAGSFDNYTVNILSNYV